MSNSETTYPSRGDFRLSDVQGNILRGYTKTAVRHLSMRVLDRDSARRWIAAAATPGDDGAPTVTDAADWETEPDVCFNLAFTYAGLAALGVPPTVLSNFSEAFREGMPARKEKLGDVGPSDPVTWQPWFQPDAPLHVIASIYGDADDLDEFERVMFPDAPPLETIGRNEGAWFEEDVVHFGYRDNISQPRFEDVTHPSKYDDQPTAPLGTVLLGHPTAFQQLRWLPGTNDIRDNATFNAFRVLEQDVQTFEDYLSDAADELLGTDLVNEVRRPEMVAAFPSMSEHEIMREFVAAKLCGRWRTGTPLELSPYDPSPDPAVSLTDFDYVTDHAGLRCPFGSHTRRTNPRGSRIVQLVANHTRRIVRRGVPYGPPITDTSWTKGRGLLGNFLCADLGAQYEGVQQDWLQMGLQDPRITGSNDPLLGANNPGFAWFDLPHEGGIHRLRGLPQFVTTRGGAYTILLSLPAMRRLGSA